MGVPADRTPLVTFTREGLLSNTPVRIFWPTEAVLDGTYTLATVRKTGAEPTRGG